MRHLGRRAWLTSLGTMLAASRAPGLARHPTPRRLPPSPTAGTLALQDFQPRSMLVVPETRVERARFPGRGRARPPDLARRGASAACRTARRCVTTRRPRTLLALMERRNLRTLVSLTGGVGAGLAD